MSVKARVRSLITAAVMSLALSAGADGANPVPGGPWADGVVSGDGGQPVNQGVAHSRERVRQAESAGANRLNDDKQQLRHTVDDSLERRRQENREQSLHLRDRATRPLYRGGY